MKSFAWLRSRPRTLASAGIVTVSAVAVTTMAFLYQGNPTTEVDLNDGGVWVTKQSSLLVGHFNHPSAVLDSGLRTASDDYDILQSGETVLVSDSTGTVTAVDPANVILSDSTAVPAGAQVVLGGQTVAVLEPASGSLWVTAADAIGAFEPASVKPLAKLGKGAAVTVATDGTVFAVSAKNRTLTTVTVDPEGEADKTSTSNLDALPKDSEVSVTAVGDRAVVLDSRSGSLIVPGGVSTTVGEGAVLQQPSAATAAVAVATSNELLSLPLDGSEPKSIDAKAQGAASAPVSLNGCVYAAWSGSAKFVRDCTGDANDLTTDIQGVEPTAKLVFRQNRDVVVLNDTVGGMAWMAADDMQQVDNWDDIIPPEGEEKESDEDTQDETVQTTLPERSEKNTPPEAVDDAFGVRPGRTTILPVLSNDNDLDGDVLTVSLPDGSPTLGDVQIINDGSGLQIAVPENASGNASFVYEVDDGRGGRDRATVKLSVHDWSVNAPPKQIRTTTIAVESGGVVTYNVLPDWIDPDGDDVYLVAADPDAGDEADITPDGRITYRAINGSQGRKDVSVTVSDGSKVTLGTLRLDVRPPGSTVPVTTADHVVVRVNQSVTVSPLVNDLSAGKEPLRLTRVDEVKGAKIGFNPSGSTFTFSAAAVGTYYVQYLASAGANGVPGIVRVDVVDDTDTQAPPIAVRDVALLPSGGETLVNVLANDIDPAGGILVVQSVTLPPSSGISVSVLNHETLRIADQAALTEQVVVSYTISNGAKSAKGSVVVIPIAAPSKIRPPVANDDTAVVRVGDIVTIPVLANDYSPSGSTIHVAPDLVEPVPDADQGDIFVAQDTVRFRASDKPGTVYATYQVVDATGQKDAAYVKIQVLPLNADTNAAPRPEAVTARVLSGSTVRIPIELNGIDPDGDSVELVGVADAPSKGRVEVGTDHLTYEALADSVGTDRFTYRVRDRLGKEATATVTIGIAPSESVNQAPYAVKDSVVMRPGRTVAVPVLVNDSDPDGDAFGLVSDGLILPDAPGLKAKVVGDRVQVTSPSDSVQTSLQYTIKDSRGARAVAVLQITVKPNVPLLSPIARDDRIVPADIKGTTVDVPVLENDEDPDGTREALKVSVSDPGATVRTGGVVRVTLGEKARLLTYTVTDEDGLTASAFIFVPAVDGLPPVLSTTKTLEVKSGETVRLPLGDWVRTSNGRPAVITEHAKVSALHGNGDDLVVDQTTLVYTSQANYYGGDALTFEVTDGDGPDDAKGHKATLTIPITVLPPDNQSPKFVNGQLDVAPGEDANTLDLQGLTTDPDPGDLKNMRYTLLGGATDGITASIDGQTLQASAGADTPKGTAASLRVRIEDGESAPVEGTVTVRVSASTRSLPTANDDVIPQAAQGQSITVKVLANDFNPFPDTPLRVTSAVVESGSGTAETSGSDGVTVQPAGDFVGNMVVRYRIQDATKDVDREVEGRIRLTVQGRPDAPGKPTVSSVQDRTVVLSWTPPVDNGAEITGYTVTATKGGYSKQCSATTCTLDGLTNNVEYNFTVTATNRVGTSDKSVPSETARPDARPDTPQPPTLKYGDRSLSVAWVTPSTPGSPVETFTLEISPAPPSGIAQKTGVKGNSLVWEGLENGVAYQVRVRAHNRAPDPSEWSGWSATEVPARAPDAVAAPTSRTLQSVGTQSQMQVTWDPPANNGDDISGYQLEVRRGGSVIDTVTGIPGGQTAQAVTVPNDTTGYTFRVRASNKAGWGAWGAESAPRRAAGTPAAPTGVSADPGNNSITVTYTKGSLNGASASEVEYQYSLNNGAWKSDWNGSKITSGVANNDSYTVRVRAFSTVQGSDYPGTASAASNKVEPYGPIGDPKAKATASGTSITYSWSPPARNGRDITKMEISIDGGGWSTVSQSDSTSRSYGYSETHSIKVRATDAAGQTSTASDSATTVDKPKARAWVTKGTSGSWATCDTYSCAKLKLNTSNFPAGTYYLQCTDGGTPFSGRNFSVPANGTIELGCYYGNPGHDVWVIVGSWGPSEHLNWY